MNTSSLLDYFQVHKKIIFIAKDHMYIMNFVAQLKRNSLNLSCKITSQDLFGPSFIAI
jgi:hypothetical protein